MLEEGATVRTLKHEVVFEIRDLDMLTSKQDIILTLQRELDQKVTILVDEAAIKTVRNVYGGT